MPYETGNSMGLPKAHLVPNDFGKIGAMCTPASIHYLEDSLVRLEKGADPTPTFPLYGKRDSSIVEELEAILGKGSLPDWLAEYERSRKEKFGPQGGIPKWDDVKEDFMLYATRPTTMKVVHTGVMDIMKRRYAELRCSKLGVREVLAHLIRTDKVETRAAGWNTFNLKKTDRTAQREAVRLACNGDWRKGYGYVFTRYNKLKKRIFMPMSFSSMLVQACYYVPFLAGIQKDLLLQGTRSPFVAWADKIGFDKCFDLMEQELNAAQLRTSEYVVYLSTDFEKMDTATASSQYMNIVIPCMKAAFHAKGKDRSIDDAMLFTTTAPIVTPSGTLVGNHGTASGAEVTNGGETLVNDYFQIGLIWLLEHIHGHEGHVRCVSRRVNGDDSIMIFFVDEKLPFTEFEEYVRDSMRLDSDRIGIPIQTEKLEISTVYGKYCQNVLEYKPGERRLFWCYPLTLVLNSIVHPEREYTRAQWDKDYRDLDIITKLDNAVNHPLYAPFVDWVMAGLKYPLLGSSEAETARILSKYKRYRELQSLGERFNRQDYDISDSPTVKYVLSKRNG